MDKTHLKVNSVIFLEESNITNSLIVAGNGPFTLLESLFGLLVDFRNGGSNILNLHSKSAKILFKEVTYTQLLNWTGILNVK